MLRAQQMMCSLWPEPRTEAVPGPGFSINVENSPLHPQREKYLSKMISAKNIFKIKLNNYNNKKKRVTRLGHFVLQYYPTNYFFSIFSFSSPTPKLHLAKQPIS